MAAASVGPACYGVNRDGDLLEAGELTQEGNFQAVQHPRTFPCRPATGRPKGMKLLGTSWLEHCNAVAKDSATLVYGGGSGGADIISPDKVLLIEGKTCVLQPPFSAGGLVVRRNGVCYLSPPAATVALGGAAPPAFEFGFVLVESGGILQAGYAPLEEDSHSHNYRVPWDRPVVLRLVGDAQGWWKTGVPASQYPTKVLNPGMEADDQCYGADPSMTPGHPGCLANTTTPKSLGVCFNGTVHFAGEVPDSIPYSLWRAGTGYSSGTRKDLSLGSLIVNNNYGDKPQWRLEDAPELWWKPEHAYPGTFVEIVDVGDNYIITKKAVPDWPAGAQVAVSSPSPSWDYDNCGTHSPSPLGDGPPNSRQGWGGGCTGAHGLETGPCAARAPGFFVHGEGTPPPKHALWRGGVEVVRVGTVEAFGGGDQSKVTFVDKFVFSHRAGRSKFQSLRNENVEVETYAHAGLVTRSVRVEGACLGKASQAGATWNDPAGAKYFSRDGKGTRPPVGHFNVVMESRLEELRAQACPSTPPPQVDWEGPGGGVQCDLVYKHQCAANVNNAGWLHPGGTCQITGTHLFDYYRKNLAPRGGCLGPTLSISKGSWPEAPKATDWYGQKWANDAMGREDCSGLDCVLGGSVKVMYGASFRFDGVEMVRMGLPGNSGSLGQYSLHFHLAGWGKAFQLYTSPPETRRELVFENGTNWRSFARWCVLHGTNLATIRNNVFVLSGGNGIFLEDGVEVLNDIEHNLCYLATSTSTFVTAPDGQKQVLYNEFQGNPLGGVIGTGGFDNQVQASMWITNMNNHIVRNVVAHNPGMSLGFWVLGETPVNKQGPANLITGDKDLRLPGLMGGSLVRTKPRLKYRDGWKPPQDVLVGTDRLWEKAPVWVGATEQYWVSALAYKGTGQDNGLTQTAYRCFAENVCYGVSGFSLELSPEAPFGNDDMVPTRFYKTHTWLMPSNADPSGGQLLHAFGGIYSNLGTFTSSKVWHRSPRVFVQNLIFDLGGPTTYGGTVGTIAWCQSGGFVSIGDGILGQDHWSAATNAAIDPQSYLVLGMFNAIICDSIIAGPVPGTTMAGEVGPAKGGSPTRGVLLYGDPVLSKTSACMGTGHKRPMYPTPDAGDFGSNPPVFSCQTGADGVAPSFVVMAGYGERGPPLGGDPNAMNDAIVFLQRTSVSIYGMKKGNMREVEPAGWPGNQSSVLRALVYDYGNQEQVSTYDPAREVVEWSAPGGRSNAIDGQGGWGTVKAQSNQIAPGSAVERGKTIPGCGGTAHSSSIQKAILVLGLSEDNRPGAQLYSFVCAAMPYMPGYTHQPPFRLALGDEGGYAEELYGGSAEEELYGGYEEPQGHPWFSGGAW